MESPRLAGDTYRISSKSDLPPALTEQAPFDLLPPSTPPPKDCHHSASHLEGVPHRSKQNRTRTSLQGRQA